MASVLLMSKVGDGIPVALKLAREGHIVKVYIKDKKGHNSLKGFKNPSRVGTAKMLDQYDLILYDMAGLGDRADEMISRGRTVLGGGKFNDKLELERDYGLKVARSVLRTKIPESRTYKDRELLKLYLNSKTRPVAIKPLGNAETRFTLVSNDHKNRTIKSLVDNLSDELLPCIVQDKVKGIEVSTEGWFNGEEFKCFNHTIEYKRMMEGDVGPMTGCMGNVVWSCEQDKLVDYALIPLVPLLKKVDYCGPLDVNCSCTEDEAYFLEFTPRFGYDAIQAWSELIRGTLFDFLWRLSIGDTLPKIRDDYAIAVRLTVPPYPMSSEEDLKQLKGVQFLDISDGARRHVHLADVMVSANAETCAGVDGVLGCVTARGELIQEVRRRAYRTARNITIHEDVQYRKDIGAGVERKIEKLKTWGWLDA